MLIDTQSTIHHITFRLATAQDKDLVWSMWQGDDVTAFREMWPNFTDWLQGKKDLFDYWLALYDGQPFGLIMVNDPSAEPKWPEAQPWIGKSGEARALDVMIADGPFRGKGLGPAMIEAFARIQPPEVTCFLIDPETENERAVHVYQKAGFQIVDSFVRKEGVSSAGKSIYMMKWVFRRG